MRKVLMFGALLLVARGGVADWQYTTWTMTREEVVAAGEGKISPTSNAERLEYRIEGGTPHLTAPYTSGSLEFRAFFIFRNAPPHNLMQVRLVQEKGSCTILRQTLKQKYGEPIVQPIGRNILIVKWRDETGGNQVTVTETSNCTLIYSPLPSSDATGL